MSDDALLRKIAALMAKANGTDNEHESDAFMTKAKEMMDKYGIKAEDLTTDKINHALADFTIAADLIWQNRLVFATARYFGAIALETRNYKVVTYKIVGRDSVRATVSVMFPYLLKEVRRQAADLINGASLGSNVRSIGIALAERLNEEAPEEDAAIRKYIDEGFQTHKVKQNRTKINAGAREAAKKINLSKQVNTATKVKRIA
jgi:hypothetical protein